MTLKQRACPSDIHRCLTVRGSRLTKMYQDSKLLVIYTEEPFGGGSTRWRDPYYGIHLSISCSDRDPTWEEQRDAVWQICSGITMASYIVPPDKHSTLGDSHVFHWFEVLPIIGYIERLGEWL